MRLQPKLPATTASLIIGPRQPFQLHTATLPNSSSAHQYIYNGSSSLKDSVPLINMLCSIIRVSAYVRGSGLVLGLGLGRRLHSQYMLSVTCHK